VEYYDALPAEWNRKKPRPQAPPLKNSDCIKRVNRNSNSYIAQEAVKRGLKWLARHQLPDGSWNFDHCRAENCTCGSLGKMTGCTNGATALGILPFLGCGQTQREGGGFRSSELNLASRCTSPNPVSPADGVPPAAGTHPADGDLRKRRSARKNGPPSSAVRIPTGISSGKMAIRAKVSQRIRRIAPPKKADGKRTR